jgi:hypothetical protein
MYYYLYVGLYIHGHSSRYDACIACILSQFESWFSPLHLMCALCSRNLLIFHLGLGDVCRNYDLCAVVAAEVFYEDV